VKTLRKIETNIKNWLKEVIDDMLYNQK